MNLEEHGCSLVPGNISEDVLNTLRDTLFQENSAGERCLLDHPSVRETALALKRELISTGHLPPIAVAIQAIGFNKTANTNWKVAWHQDLMFPFTKRVTADYFDLPTVKQGVHYARPPESCSTSSSPSGSISTIAMQQTAPSESPWGPILPESSNPPKSRITSPATARSLVLQKKARSS